MAHYQQPPPPRFSQQPSHHPDAVFVNSYPRETSVRSMTIPVVLAAIGAAFLVGVTYAATLQFSDIKYSIRDLSKDVKSLNKSLTDRINRVEKEGERRTVDRWTRRQHENWCDRAQAANTKIGWRCPKERTRSNVSSYTPDWRPTVK